MIRKRKPYYPKSSPFNYGRPGSYPQPQLKPFRPRGGPYTWGTKENKKYTTQEKQQIAELERQGTTYKDIVKISESLMKKVYKHGDTPESVIEDVAREHPEYRSLPWTGRKKILQKRLPYLTSKEIDFLGKVSGDFER